ncbi:MAG: DUF2141 domain-containing protein [Pirellula sp.]
MKRKLIWIAPPRNPEKRGSLGAFVVFLCLCLGCGKPFDTASIRPSPAETSTAEPLHAEVLQPGNSQSPRLLKVVVSGFEGQEGRCRVALYRNQEGFNQPEKAFAKETLELPNEGPLAWTIELSPEDIQTPVTRWAISAHHDKNANDKLDKNAFGIPTEAYGFSNNPKRGFGPPKFDEVCFEIQPDALNEPMQIEIRIY